MECQKHQSVFGHSLAKFLNKSGCWAKLGIEFNV